MLLLGFGAALRRSEIVAPTIRDVKRPRSGRITVSRISVRSPAFEPGWDLGAAARISPHRRPTLLPCPRQPHRPLSVGRRPTAVLRHHQRRRPDGHADVEQDRRPLMKPAWALAGVDPTRFSGNSLRRGLLTTAAGLLAAPGATRHSALLRRDWCRRTRSGSLWYQPRIARPGRDQGCVISVRCAVTDLLTCAMVVSCALTGAEGGAQAPTRPATAPPDERAPKEQCRGQAPSPAPPPRVGIRDPADHAAWAAHRPRRRRRRRRARRALPPRRGLRHPRQGRRHAVRLPLRLAAVRGLVFQHRPRPARGRSRNHRHVRPIRVALAAI